MQHPHFFQGDESTADHFVEGGEEGVDFFLAVHDFDDEWQVHGEAQDFGGVQTAGFAEAHRAAQHGRAGQMRLAGGEHDGFVERLVLPAVGFADEDAEKEGVSGDLHSNFELNH